MMVKKPSTKRVLTDFLAEITIEKKLEPHGNELALAHIIPALAAATPPSIYGIKHRRRGG